MPADYNFSHLKFEKSLLKTIYNSANFSHIVFRWVPGSATNTYKLNGVAYRLDGSAIGSPFDLVEYSPPPAKKLTNNYVDDGILLLTKAEMTSNDMNGDTDGFFKPKQLQSVYVAYKISSKSIEKKAIRDFDLNPSPPR